MVNTSQQLGGAVGTAVLSTIFASALKSYLTTHGQGPAALAAGSIHGYSAAFAVSAAVFVGGALVASLGLRSGRIETADDSGAAVAA